MAKKVPLPDQFAMRRSFESKFGALTDDQMPGNNFMEKRLEQIEKSDFRAELLSVVLSADDDEAETMKAIFNTSGQLEAVRVGKKVAMPGNTEELRSRMSLLGRSWVMAATLHPHQTYLRDVSPALFEKYVNYLLGKFVLGLVSMGPPGVPVSHPSWQAVLHYDHEVRKECMRNLLSGMTMGEALDKAMSCPVTRERSFTTPLARSHFKRSVPDAPRTEQPGGGQSKRQKQKGKRAAAAAEEQRGQQVKGGGKG